MGTVVAHSARARGVAVAGRGCHEQRDIAAAVHQPEDHQEPLGCDLPEARCDEPHSRACARGGYGARHHRIATGRWTIFGPFSLWICEWAVPTMSMGLNEDSDKPSGAHWGERGEYSMTELFLNAFFAVRGFHANLLERARTERGASMVEYALLVGLIAVVAVVAIAALGGGIKGLF